MTDRIAPQVEELWEEFHGVVNMTSGELRAGLMTAASGESAYAGHPDRLLPDMGRRVLAVLGKRKVDLTADDVETMRQVTEQVNGRLTSPPARGAQNDAWRRSLMTVGHDPLKPDPRGSEETP